MVNPSPAPETKRAHWPALDGWRGFTIWFAISVHAGYFTAGGVLSLDTFFVLSGFLITGLLIREWNRSDGIDLLAFWARRARGSSPRCSSCSARCWCTQPSSRRRSGSTSSGPT